MRCGDVRWGMKGEKVEAVLLLHELAVVVRLEGMRIGLCFRHCDSAAGGVRETVGMKMGVGNEGQLEFLSFQYTLLRIT